MTRLELVVLYLFVLMLVTRCTPMADDSGPFLGVDWHEHLYPYEQPTSP